MKLNNFIISINFISKDNILTSKTLTNNDFVIITKNDKCVFSIYNFLIPVNTKKFNFNLSYKTDDDITPFFSFPFFLSDIKYKSVEFDDFYLTYLLDENLITKCFIQFQIIKN